MRINRLTRVPMALTALALLASACGLGSPSAAGTPTPGAPIKVGISEPLTGDKSDIGTNSDNGYKVWESVVNSHGGINGRHVQIIQYDNSSLADTAVSQYQKLITVDNVDVLLGPVSSALVIPTEAVAAQDNKVFVQGSVADQDAAGAVKGYSQVGFQPKVSYFASGPDSASTWLQLLSTKAEGTITSLDWLQESTVPGNKEFVDAYLKMFPNKDNVVPAEAAEAYAAGEVLAAAIKATGGVDNSKIISWLHGNKVQSVEGNFGWDSAGRPQGGTFNLIQWQSGHLNIVWPSDVATNGSKPTIPKPSW